MPVPLTVLAWGMTSSAEISAWVIEAGLAGIPETDLLRGFCERAVASGLQIARAMVGIDTLHPIHEGRIFRWYRDRNDVSHVSEYGRTGATSDTADAWRRSPYYRLIETGGSLLRRNLARGDPADFVVLEELRAEGITDYMAMIHRFAAGGVIGEMDCVYSSWSS